MNSRWCSAFSIVSTMQFFPLLQFKLYAMIFCEYMVKTKRPMTCSTIKIIDFFDAYKMGWAWIWWRIIFISIQQITKIICQKFQNMRSISFWKSINRQSLMLKLKIKYLTVFEDKLVMPQGILYPRHSQTEAHRSY